MKTRFFAAENYSLIFILISAFLFGISAPFAKLLVKNIAPVTLAGLLYLGAFIGLSLYSIGRRIFVRRLEIPSLEKKDFPCLICSIITGGIIAPICMMMGLTLVSGFSASLMLNLEGVATSLIAFIFFKEPAGKRFWWALIFIFLAGFFLTWNVDQMSFNLAGPSLLLLAMASWGADNNFTRNISNKDPVQIAQIKGLFAGTASLLLAWLLGFKIPLDLYLVFALILGSLSYGASVDFFIKSLSGLGSARTAALFGLAPFIGAILSLIIFRDWTSWTIFPAGGLMAFGAWLLLTERHSHLHSHHGIYHIHSHWPDIDHRHEHNKRR